MILTVVLNHYCPFGGGLHQVSLREDKPQKTPSEPSLKVQVPDNHILDHGSSTTSLALSYHLRPGASMARIPSTCLSSHGCPTSLEQVFYIPKDAGQNPKKEEHEGSRCYPKSKPYKPLPTAKVPTR